MKLVKILFLLLIFQERGEIKSRYLSIMIYLVAAIEEIGKVIIIAQKRK